MQKAQVTAASGLTEFLDATPVAESSTGDTFFLPDQATTQAFTYEGVLDRKYAIAQDVVWDTSDAIGATLLSYDFPNGLFTEPQILSVIDQYAYMQWDGIHITITMNAVKMLYGTLLIYVIPHGGLMSAQNIWHATTYEHCLMSAVAGESVSLVVPWVYPNPYWNVRTGAPGVAFTLRVIVANPLTVCTAEGVVAAHFSVLANFVSPKLYVPTGRGLTLGPMLRQLRAEQAHHTFAWVPRRAKRLAATSREVSVAQAKHKTHKKGSGVTFLRNDRESAQLYTSPTQTAPQTNSTPAGFLSSIPVVGQLLDATGLAGVADTLLGSAGKLIGGLFGFSKPTAEAAPQLSTLTYAADVTHADTVDYSTVLAYHHGVRLDTRQPVGGCSDDELDLRHVLSTPSMVAHFAMAPGAVRVVPTSPLYHQSIDTVAKTLTSTPFLHTFCMFQHWRGSRNYHVHLCANGFMTGRLRIRWLPVATGAEDPSTLDYPQDVFTQIVDIQTTTELSFFLPYVSDHVWDLTEGHNPAAADTQYYGALVFDWANELTMPEPVDAPVYVMVYMAGGNDFELANPAPAYAYGDFGVPFNTAPAADAARVVAEEISRAQAPDDVSAGMRSKFQRPFDPFHPTFCHTREAGMTLGPDRFSTLREFTQTYQWFGRTTSNYTTGQLVYNIRSRFSTDYTEFISATGVTLTPSYPLVQWYIAMMYQFVRGSWRLRVVNAEPRTMIRMNADRGTQTTPTLMGDHGNTIALSSMDYHPIAAGQVPYNSRLLFRTAIGNLGGNVWPGADVIHTTTVATSAPTVPTNFYFAFGDDWSAHYLHGPGLVYYGKTP